MSEIENGRFYRLQEDVRVRVYAKIGTGALVTLQDLKPQGLNGMDRTVRAYLAEIEATAIHLQDLRHYHDPEVPEEERTKGIERVHLVRNALFDSIDAPLTGPEDFEAIADRLGIARTKSQDIRRRA